jgi:hypothetical protein
VHDLHLLELVAETLRATLDDRRAARSAAGGCDAVPANAAMR